LSRSLLKHFHLIGLTNFSESNFLSLLLVHFYVTGAAAQLGDKQMLKKQLLIKLRPLCQLPQEGSYKKLISDIMRQTVSFRRQGGEAVMHNLNKYLSACIDSIEEGLITIDGAGKIKVCNDRACRFFGIDPNVGPGHSAGKINSADIVILVNNCLGADDGNLTPQDLGIIGVNPSHVRPGTGIIAIGSYNTGAPAKYKISTEGNGVVHLGKNINNVPISAAIDYNNKDLVIKVQEQHFNFFYSLAAGHLVILDGETLKIKFYQCKGYTARRESIKSILAGNPYTRKGPGTPMPKIFNKPVQEIFPDSEIIDQLICAAKGICKESTDKAAEKETIVNGIPIRCSIVKIKQDGLVIGATLIFKDVTEIKTLLKQRDQALASMEYLEGELKRKSIRRNALKEIIGESDCLKQAINLAMKASDTNSNVLLLGESGTGKNLFADAIHKASIRRKGPFVYINCSSIPENLIESELFGYEKGAFTGALTSGKTGKFAQAHQGTIFLDEIGELSINLQAKLLHFLQNKSFTRVGGLEQINVDVRVIAATNKDLEKLIENNKFREDLYYRINVMAITIPPLRDRKDDIKPLVQYLLPKICKRMSKKVKNIDQDAINILKSYHWRGNVRELENVLERAINLASGATIFIKDLPKDVIENLKKPICDNIVEVMYAGPVKETLRRVERQLLLKALELSKGSRKEAMEQLQLKKTNFYAKLKEHGINSSETESIT